MRMMLSLRQIVVAVTAGFGLIGAAAAGGHGHSSGGDVHVNGYYKADGTYVAPHMRSAPDGDFSNNWTTQGNVNPYTGKEGTRITPPSNYGGHLVAPPASPSFVDPSATPGFDPSKIDFPGTASSPLDLSGTTRPLALPQSPAQPATAAPQQMQSAMSRAQSYMDRTHQESVERAAYWNSKGYNFNPSYMSAYMMDQKVNDIDRAAYWKQRGYDFNPNYMSAYLMDQKVNDIERAKYWKAKGYDFNPQFMSAYLMDQKVTDIDRARYWKSQGFDFNPQYMTAYLMDMEAQRRLGQRH